MIQEGMKAYNFTLNDKNGKPVSAFRFHWSKGVLYFYPKDNTPGCTRQACAFAESYKEFEEMGAVVIGISKDSEASAQ